VTARRLAALLALLEGCGRAAPGAPAATTDSAERSTVTVPEAPRPRTPLPVVLRKVTDSVGSDAGAGDRSLEAGEIVSVSAGDKVQLDVGLAVRIVVGGPAQVATDPDTERVLYALGPSVHLSVQPDSAARPYAVELATPCGSLRIPRAAEVDVRMTPDGACTATLEAGAGAWEVPGAPQEGSIPLDEGVSLRCTLTGSCAPQPAPAPGEMPRDAVLADHAERLAARLRDGTDEIIAMRAGALQAVGNIRPGQHHPEHLALQRRLSHEAAFGLRARARLRSLLHAYGAAVLAQVSPWSAAPSAAARAALRREP
jgi:hypothetical protein